MTEFNAADEQQVKRRETTAKRQQRHRDDDLAELLKLPAFRRWAWVLICEKCKLYQSPFSSNGSVQTLNIGRQDVGRELFADIERIDPELITAAMREYAEAQKA